MLDLNKYPNDKIYGQLFADDLSTFNIDKNLKRLQIQMNRYLKHLEAWLNKWRLSMAPHKCSFTIYAKKIPIQLKNGEFKLELYGKQIPMNHSPKYLGVILDRNLNLIDHTNTVRRKCLKLTNILKCLAYKNWSLSEKKQLNIYKILIRSCLEHAAPLVIMSESNVKKLQGIQYQSLKIIAKESLGCSSQYLHDLFQIETIESRLYNLSSKYLELAIRNKNPMIINLIDTITYSAGRIKTPLEKIGYFK